MDTMNKEIFHKAKKHRNKRGAAMVEFALVLPILIMLLFGIIELGRAFYTWSLMSEAVREGARAGVVELNNTTAVNVATQVANNFLIAVALPGTAVSSSIVTLSGSIKAVNVQANFAFQPLGLNGVIPPFTLTARSLMRQEGQ